MGDEPLGKAILNVQDIMEKSSITNAWKPLKNSKAGEILFTAKFSPTKENRKKKSTVQTSHTVQFPSDSKGSVENLLISHNIQLPEGFSVESINSDQTVSHNIVPVEKP